MGIYINPKDQTKEDWLQQHGRVVSRNASIPASDVLVCWNDRLIFTQAAVCYDERERTDFSNACDTAYVVRSRWYAVPKTAILPLLDEYDQKVVNDARLV